eukprot:45595-Eustigmatos_ZCMA.PRE.1
MVSGVCFQWLIGRQVGVDGCVCRGALSWSWVSYIFRAKDTALEGVRKSIRCGTASLTCQGSSGLSRAFIYTSGCSITCDADP